MTNINGEVKMKIVVNLIIEMAKDRLFLPLAEKYKYLNIFCRTQRQKLCKMKRNNKRSSK